jgi:type I restriction enzyme M protein
LVECKKEDLTDQQFNIAVDQAYSYAVAEGAKYVWTTSRIKNQYYEVPDKKPKSRIEIPDIPQFGIDKLATLQICKRRYFSNQTQKQNKNQLFKRTRPEL